MHKSTKSLNANETALLLAFYLYSYYGPNRLYYMPIILYVVYHLSS